MDNVASDAGSNVGGSIASNVDDSGDVRSTDHCTCTAPGFCHRHRIRKVGRLWDICQGKVLTPEVCESYRKIWDEQAKLLTEQGEPKDAIAGDHHHGMRGLGDLAAVAISAVTFGLVKPCGGCKERQQKLNELFPFGSANDKSSGSS